METWAIVTLVLGASAISALLTFFITKMQVRHSDRRFGRELERAKEVDYHQRRWEVRGKPLLKLRDELAQMAVKLEKLVASAQRKHTRFGGTEEEVEKELQKAVGDWNAYLANGGIAQTLFIQYDPELVNRVEKIRKDYQQSYFDHIHIQNLDAKEAKEAFHVFKRNEARIIEVQELINKRLGDL